MDYDTAKNYSNYEISVNTNSQIDFILERKKDKNWKVCISKRVYRYIWSIHWHEFSNNYLYRLSNIKFIDNVIIILNKYLSIIIASIFFNIFIGMVYIIISDFTDENIITFWLMMVFVFLSIVYYTVDEYLEKLIRNTLIKRNLNILIQSPEINEFNKVEVKKSNKVVKINKKMGDSK